MEMILIKIVKSWKIRSRYYLFLLKEIKYISILHRPKKKEKPAQQNVLKARKPNFSQKPKAATTIRKLDQSKKTEPQTKKGNFWK